MVDFAQSQSVVAGVIYREIRRWLADRFCPTAIVFSSGAVRETLLKQSSLGPAELLRPFSDVGNLNNIALQTCEKNQPFRLQNFKMNFVDAHKLDQKHHYDNSMLIDFIIQNSTPKKFQDISTSGAGGNAGQNQKDQDLQMKRKLLSLLDYHKHEQLTPWFSKWKRQFLQQSMFADHELVNQPMAFLYFISATEHDPLGTIDILRRADNLPSLYKEGVYDDSQAQQFILILNPTDNPKVYFDALDTVKQKYPIQNIFEIRMTRDPQAQPPLEDLWSRSSDLDEQGLMQELHMESLLRGRSFSNDDRDRIMNQIRRMIEKLVLPSIEKRIRSLEVSIANTRKGIKNQFKNLWKKTERGENDGLKENFKMNKEELELRNLVDLAFVTQDYETALHNGKLPLSDFKKCKAQRHAASCQEILVFAQFGFDQSLINQGSVLKELDQALEQAYQMYQRAGKTQYLIRCALYISELYDCLERHQESANFLLRIANELKDNSVIVPLFQEQAAYKYLQMRNFRKFALHMILAGKSYERLNLQSYSFNCFTIVHPFYQRYGKGWNGIRFQLYSSLGRNSQNMGDITLAVQFFRNLLQLCCEFDHQNEQKNCLNEFLIAVQNWSSQKSLNLLGVDEGAANSTQRKAHIGQLNLPIIIEDSLEVFLSHEKLYTNKPEQLINQLYFAYPNSSAGTSPDDNQEYVIQQKAELNSANCPWKFMAKHLFELINDERRKNPQLMVAPEAGQFSIDELSEFSVYDCASRVRKRELLGTKVRKGFVGEAVVVKLLMRNPLMADIFINNIKLICRYEKTEENKNQEATDEDFEQVERNIVLRSLETKEILLEIFPKRAGKFIIERIEWVLFDVVSCAYQMVKPTDKDRKLGLTQEELVVPKKLLDRESTFILEVLPRSAEVSAKIIVPEANPSDPHTFIFTELQKAELEVTNQSYRHALINGYAVCSHPMIFGFSRMRLFDRVDKGSKFTLPLLMRASLMQNNDIKFLIRYEVELDEQESQQSPNSEQLTPTAEGDISPSKKPEGKKQPSRFRFCRLVFNIDSLYAFTPKRHVHLSTKKANEHIFNIQIVDNLPPSSANYQTPIIQAVEIVNRRGLWTLRKKDDRGQFFIIMPRTDNEETQSLLLYNKEMYSENGESGGIRSILEDPAKQAYFEQEQAFVMSKFKMQPTNEDEEVDIVIQWSMPRLNKKGFYCLFKIPLLKIQKQLTEQQRKLQRQRNQQKEGALMRELPKINPLHLAYQYQQSVSHDFSSNKPAMVSFSLSLSNMIQSSEFQVNCKVEALNEWTTLANPTDVSEANSFLWVGKTQYIINNLKTNEIKNVTLRCAIVRPGVYNLNRFRVVIVEGNHNNNGGENGEDSQAATAAHAVRSHFVNEIRLPDDILISVTDTSIRNNATEETLKDQNLITF